MPIKAQKDDNKPNQVASFKGIIENEKIPFAENSNIFNKGYFVSQIQHPSATNHVSQKRLEIGKMRG